MKRFSEKLPRISRLQLFALGLVVLGIAIMIPRAWDMLDFYKKVRYAQQHNFQAGNPSPDLLQPWMSTRYIAATYAVPQGYLFEAMNIQPKRETSLMSIERLNRELGLGTLNGQPVLLGSVRATIVAYRANPVATGLLERKVENWMTVQYIANSTGIPAQDIFEAIGLPMEGNAHKPLGLLSREVDYPGGSQALTNAIQKVVEPAP